MEYFEVVICLKRIIVFFENYFVKLFLNGDFVVVDVIEDVFFVY